MQQILLVEDSLMFGKLAKRKIEKEFDLTVFWAKSYKETEAILQEEGASFSMALLDFNLPDAPEGQVIDRVVKEGISSFVFTGSMSEEVRTKVWKKKVADYIIKEDPNSLHHVVTAMRQMQENQQSLVLFVDGSSSFRTEISELLYIRQYRVLNASDGTTALDILDQYPEIKLVITDFNMPDMDGCMLCQKIREKHKAEQLALIGFSSSEDRSLGARFLKAGANDFMTKQSFLVEEFYSRVHRCLESVRLIEKIHESTTRDFLTGLSNRQHLFETGSAMATECFAKEQSYSCSLIDIDLFKQVNDEFGYGVGDEVINKVSEILIDTSGEQDIVGRVGGQEFCILSPDDSQENCFTRMEIFRKIIESTAVATSHNRGEVFVTCSIGTVVTTSEGLEAMLGLASDRLDRAKESGRNRVEI